MDDCQPLRLCQWAYQIYDQTVHPALGQTPREAFERGLAASGKRRHRWIAYDDHFQLMTLPTTARGTAKVLPGQGVKIHHLYYWSNVFRDPGIEGAHVAVRYDPYDASIAYACVRNQWVECISQHYACFQGRSEREIMLATAELRKRSQVRSTQFTITAKRLAEFLSSVEAEESLLLQRLRDKETQGVSTAVHGERPCLGVRSQVLPATMPLVCQAVEPERPAQPHQPEVYEDY